MAVLSLLALHGTASLAAGFPESVVAKQLRTARKLVTVDLSNLKPGSYRAVVFDGAPVLVYHRTAQDIHSLRSGETSQLANPSDQGFRAIIEDNYRSSTDIVWTRLYLVTEPALEKTPLRSRRDEYLVAMKSGPSGCRLMKPSEKLRPPSGLFMDVCSGLWYDAAGRVLKNNWTGPPLRTKGLPQANLLIPPHYFKSPTQLVLGVPSGTLIPTINEAAVRARFYSRMTPGERLLYAAAYNDTAMVKKCLADGVSVNQPAGRARPINGAIAGGSRAIVDLLLAHGAIPTPASIELAGMTHREEVKKLLERSRKKTD